MSIARAPNSGTPTLVPQIFVAVLLVCVAPNESVNVATMVSVPAEVEH
jgi:hypothetical protein